METQVDPQILPTASGREKIPMLDLELSVSVGGQVSFQTHRKELNNYLYLPRSSCHPTASFQGLIRGECIRLRRTCSSSRAYHAQLDFFVKKLLSRGYEKEFIYKNIKIAMNPRRADVRIPQERVSYFKVIHSSSLRKKSIVAILRKHDRLLGGRKVRLAIGVQRNFFRSAHRRNFVI